MPPAEQKRELAFEFSTFQKAISDRNEWMITSYLKKEKKEIATLLTMKDKYHGRNILQHALITGSPLKQIKLLVDAGIEHNLLRQMLTQRDSKGKNVLLHAYSSERPFESFKLLFDSCVHTDCQKEVLSSKDDESGATTLLTALKFDIDEKSVDELFRLCTHHLDKKTLKELLEAQLEKNDGDNCIHFASRSRNFSFERFCRFLDFFVDHGANVGKMILQRTRLFKVNSISMALSREDYNKSSTGIRIALCLMAYVPSQKHLSTLLRERDGLGKNVFDYYTDAQQRQDSHRKSVLRDDEKNNCWRKSILRYRDYFGHFPKKNHEVVLEELEEATKSKSSSCVLQ